MKDIAIVGAGASGLCSAIMLAQKGLKVTLFEQNAKVAKKILVSGNGRCNITNTNLSNHYYFGENKTFVNNAIKEFGFLEFKKFVNSIGILLDIKEDGKVYPLSNEAKGVVHIFEDYAKTLDVKINYNTRVNAVKDLIKKYDAVIIATGSRAASHLGGNNDGELFAKEFGHTIIPAYPSLVQLEIDSAIIHKMAGTKINAEVALFINHQKELAVQGDILFTNYGVSGFAILDISQYASKALLEFNHISISINLLPNFTQQQLATHITNISKNTKNFTIVDILAGILPIKIIINLLNFLKIPHTTIELTPKIAKKIANTIQNWRFDVKDTHGFRYAEVSGGGINTDEIDPKTMESLKQKNLYFTGEVLDVVGKRGGYNFAFAWASAYLASKSIINKKI